MARMVDQGNKVVFSPDGCELIHGDGSVLKAERKGHLFYLPYSEVVKEKVQLLVAPVAEANFDAMMAELDPEDEAPLIEGDDWHDEDLEE